jgi:hypothetical protein
VTGGSFVLRESMSTKYAHKLQNVLKGADMHDKIARCVAKRLRTSGKCLRPATFVSIYL